MKTVQIETTEDMYKALESESKEKYDLVIHASAVGDYKSEFSFRMEDLAKEICEIKDKSYENVLDVLTTNAPIVFPELQVQKQAMWNEALTFLGINNANTEKRERLITNEVDANNVHIDLSAECFLKAREKACEQINRVFGTEISVTMRERGEEECLQDIQNV